MRLMGIFTPRWKLPLFILRLDCTLNLLLYSNTYRTDCCLPPYIGLSKPGGKYLNKDTLFTLDLFVGLITDATILVLHISLAWSLHLPLKTKIKAAVVLSAGGARGLATVSNIYRLMHYCQVWAHLTYHTFNTTDSRIRIPLLVVGEAPSNEKIVSSIQVKVVECLKGEIYKGCYYYIMSRGYINLVSHLLANIYIC